MRTGLHFWLPAALLLGVAETAGAAIEIVGTNSATFEWTPATGPVVGYSVYASINGAEEIHYSDVFGQTGETVTVSIGDTLIVRVAAFDETDLLGPFSEPSEEVHFAAAEEPPAEEPPPPAEEPPPPAEEPPAEEPPPEEEPPAEEPPPPAEEPPPPAEEPPAEEPPPEEEPPAEEPPPPAEEGEAAALDFDGNGTSDLILRHALSGISEAWLMVGALTSDEILLHSPPSRFALVGNGDYDGDGFADALWHNPADGQLWFWQFSHGSVVSWDRIGPPLGEVWEVAGSGDFDGDGRCDILLHHLSLGTLEIWHMNGAQVRAVTELAAAPESGILADGHYAVWATGDYDGDGFADILLHEREGGRVVVWRTFGLSAIQEQLVGSVPRTWRLSASADFDGDGTSDLLLHHKRQGRLELWRIQEGVVVEQSPLAAKKIKVAAAGDFDADGQADLVIQSATGSALEMWFMSGASVRSKHPLAELAESWFVANVGEESPSGDQ